MDGISGYFGKILYSAKMMSRGKKKEEKKSQKHKHEMYFFR